MRTSFWYLLAFVFLFNCNSKEGQLFHYRSADDTNVHFTNQISESDRLNILDYLYFYNGGGVAVGDINNDGLPDIFFSANQEKNALYLNKGNFEFEDISEKAGILGNSDWNTGASMVDINNDGWLDIYVNAVVGINGFDGHNELYINNKDNTFTESSRQYNLDLDTYSSSSAFLDYDLDGDLDVYILNHAVHTQNSFGNISLRNERNYESGDRLMRNDGNAFTDVSEEAGIYGGINAYGLGISIADFNQDGYPDIYVGNDFHEDDYYYLNQQDGTFKEALKEHFTQTTRFSMGNDAADINHDGRPDLMSLDMLPDDEKVLKASEGDDNIQTMKMRTERYGYHYQFTRNMLNINQGEGTFLETALLSNVAATDWSWSVLIEDFNQDGEQDIFVSNGIPKRPNDIDFIRFVSSEKIQNKINDTKLVDQQALDLMPAGKISNYVFEGTSSLTFNNQSEKWIESDTLVSGATAFADFDNDGDLDLVINNLNSKASIIENKSNSKNYLTISLEDEQSVLGAKLFAYKHQQLQFKELYTVRGFQASSEPVIHFAYKDSEPIDSLLVVWPDNSYQKLTMLSLGQHLTVEKESQLKRFSYASLHTKPQSLFEEVTDSVQLLYTHEEDRYIDFNRQKLMPFQAGDRGPALAIGDWNNDAKTDIFFGSSKFKRPKLFVQSDSSFVEESLGELQKDSILEIVSAQMNDFNNDGKTDLFLGTGGADFSRVSPNLMDVLYLQTDSTVIKNVINDQFDNASILLSNDIDNDGDIDVFVANHIITGDYGKLPNSYLLINENGKFSISEDQPFEELGMITDAIFSDFDNDGTEDLVVVGEWQSPKFFKNNRGLFEEITALRNPINGLWQAVHAVDYDNDGDTDYLIGNWGLNSKFKASKKHPLIMYYADFDENNQSETVVAYHKSGNYYPINNLDELSGQMVFLKKKFTSYSSFAGKPIEAIFDKEQLKKASILEVSELASGILINEEGRFDFQAFPEELQLCPLQDFVTFDFNGDGTLETLVGGNYFGVTPYHSRFASFPGALINGDGSVQLTNTLGLDLSHKSIRHLKIIQFANKPHLLVVSNNDKVQLFQLKKE